MDEQDRVRLVAPPDLGERFQRPSGGARLLLDERNGPNERWEADPDERAAHVPKHRPSIWLDADALEVDAAKRLPERRVVSKAPRERRADRVARPRPKVNGRESDDAPAAAAQPTRRRERGRRARDLEPVAPTEDSTPRGHPQDERQAARRRLEHRRERVTPLQTAVPDALEDLHVASECRRGGPPRAPPQR